MAWTTASFACSNPNCPEVATTFLFFFDTDDGGVAPSFWPCRSCLTKFPVAIGDVIDGRCTACHKPIDDHRFFSPVADCPAQSPPRSQLFNNL
jgi:hypothetical protein